MGKNGVQISGFSVVKKALSPRKKNLSNLFVQIRSSKRCAEIFLK